MMQTQASVGAAERPSNAAAALPVDADGGNRGAMLLKRMGWSRTTEGTAPGLGADGQGDAVPLAVRLAQQQGRAGLGSKREAPQGRIACEKIKNADGHPDACGRRGRSSNFAAAPRPHD